MRHIRTLGFDDLESRKLLSTVHPAAGSHHAPAAVAMALNLDGTLVVNMKDATQTNDAQGDVLTLVPVSGVLGTMGKVHGIWTETVDQFGDYLGPDTIQLSNAHGSFTVSFDSANLGKAVKTAHGSVFHPLGQRNDGGTGTYAKATENGSITVITNPSKGISETMTLITATPPG